MRLNTKFLAGWLIILSSFSLLAANKLDSQAAAIIDNQIITKDQLHSEIEQELYEAELKIYEIKLNQINNMLLQRLIDSHPFSGGLQAQEFLDKYVIKDSTVSSQDIEAFIKTNRIPAEKINSEFKDKITQYIKSEKARVYVSNWFAIQSKEHGVVINLVKPQRPRKIIPIGDSPVIGNQDAKITIVEYSDFQCPFCARAESTIKRLRKEYAGNIKLVYKNFPLSFHGEAFLAAEAGMCAKEQSNDYFWQLHDKMFADPRGLKRSGLKGKVTQLRMNVEKFESCMDNKKYYSQVNRDIAEGRNFGVNSTPVFFINGVILVGNKPYEEFVAIIDEELAN